MEKEVIAEHKEMPTNELGVIPFGSLSENQLLTYAQAASYLGITPGYLRGLKSAGKIRAVELGHRITRFRVASLARFIAEREVS